MLHRLALHRVLEAVEEVGHVDMQALGDLEQAAGADAVGAGLVLLDLLVGNLQRVRQLLLGQAQLGATRTNPLSDILVNARGNLSHWWHPLAKLSVARSEEHTSELQSLMRISYAVFCLKKKKNIIKNYTPTQSTTP